MDVGLKFFFKYFSESKQYVENRLLIKSKIRKFYEIKPQILKTNHLAYKEVL